MPDEDERACRCCKHVREDLQHFATCDVASIIFYLFAELTKVNYLNLNKTDKELFALFGITPEGTRVTTPGRTHWANGLRNRVEKYHPWTFSALLDQRRDFDCNRGDPGFTGPHSGGFTRVCDLFSSLFLSVSFVPSSKGSLI